MKILFIIEFFVGFSFESDKQTVSKKINTFLLNLL
jgi:hypothetical protein